MNNVTVITKAPRLTESEVHEAAEALANAGGKVSSTEVYKHLGRGSLTTITNYLKTWHPEAQDEATPLPALADVPDGLKTAVEQLAVKVWAEAKALSEREIEHQRESLQQAEADAQERIEEAESFSEVQSKQIESLENYIESLEAEQKQHAEALEAVKAQAHETEKRVLAELGEIKQENAVLAEKRDHLESKLQKLEKDYHELETINAQHIEALEASDKQLKQAREAADKDQQRLIMQVHKRQVSLDTACKRLEEEKHRHSSTLKTAENYKEQLFELRGEFNAWKRLKPKTTQAAKPVKTGKRSEDTGNVT